MTRDFVSDDDANAPIPVVELITRRVHTLNFVVAGNVRAGTHGLQLALGGLPRVTCHQALLSEHKAVRDASHIAYFGDRIPVFDPEESGAGQYLDSMIFDTPIQNEVAIGARITYREIKKYDLTDYMHNKELSGDFCVIHVQRNPLVCLASLKQAQKTGRWAINYTDNSAAPPPINLVLEEVVEFVRDSMAVARKIDSQVQDTLRVRYDQLYLNFPQTISRICAYLELPYPVHGLTCCRRLRNHSTPRRIANFSALMSAVPPDVREEILRTPLL